MVLLGTLLEAASEMDGYAELYEYAQYNQRIIPRLYLMAALGAHYIRQGLVDMEEMSDDLMDMCLGVQHPIHGLFLRHFLVSMLRPFLERPKRISYAVDLCLRNNSEMIRFWLRLTSACAPEDVRLYEQLCAEVKVTVSDEKVLVAANLTCIAQIDGFTLEMYRRVRVSPNYSRCCQRRSS